MRIAGNRIRSLGRHLRGVKPDTTIVVGIAGLPAHASKLSEIGFTKALELGETVLPAGDLGPVSRFNAEGKEVPDKTQPMETAYRTIEWTWTEWHGPYREEKTEFRDRPYQRYPRIVIPPPSIQLTVRNTADGEKVITAPPMKYGAVNTVLLLHTVNMFLELFGECTILDERLTRATAPATVLLNWRVLPPGRYPWTKIKPLVSKLIAKAPGGNQSIITARLETLSSYEPEFVAIGTAGFHGYLIFGFPKKNLFVLEAVHTGNATYVFDKNWQELSQLTKAEILQSRLQKDRIVHLVSWFGKIKALLK